MLKHIFLQVIQYFQQTHPAAYQAMTSVMLESARKGYWKPNEDQLKAVARLHAEITEESGAACTEFVCDNEKLQTYISRQLSSGQAKVYNKNMQDVKDAVDAVKDGKILKKESISLSENGEENSLNGIIVISVLLIAFVILFIVLKRKRYFR